MNISKFMVSCIVLILTFASASTLGQAGGQSGYDTSLDAIEPESEPLQVGLGGRDPADIGRYLLAANGGARGARLSPNGEFVAFIWSVTGEPQLWLIPAVGGSPTRLTYGNGLNFFRWVSDSNRIIYGADNNGNEQEAYYTIEIEDGSESLLFQASSGGFRVFGDYISSADSITFASTERNQLDFDIYMGDLQSKQSRLVFEGSFGFFAHAGSPDGRYSVVSETVGEDSDNLYLLNLSTGEIETLSAPVRRANHASGGIAWKQDGSGFYFASNLEREFSSLMLYDLEDGIEVIESIDNDVGNVTLCGSDDRYLLTTSNQDGYSRLKVTDLHQNRVIKTPELPEGVFDIDCQGSPARLVITINGWKTPGNIWIWGLAEDSATEIFGASMAGLNPDRLVRPESISITARDGLKLQGLLYLPDDSSRVNSSPPPVVFFVHGGPTGQSRPTFDAVVQYHVDRGMAVFEPNVRGSTGFGHTYVTLDDREKRLDSVRDLIDMLNYLGQDGRVDSSRAAVVGGSYGGYAVNSVLANYPGFFITGVSLYGIADWVTALTVASPSLKASDRIEYGDITEQRWLEFYQENSPIRQADRINVPVLFSHGIMDPRIDISETEVMVRTLRGNGIDAQFIRIPDEGHGWRKLSNQLFYYRRQAEYLEEKLLFTEQ